MVGRGTADTPATALRPGDVVPESGPARVKSELSEAHAVRLVQYGRERGLGAPDWARNPESPRDYEAQVHPGY